jgi:BirA family biotin operon repressor/biotin-[acetyl-CoA-carboxylase] ligase
VAEEQTNGLGRSGRKWESPKGENLYFSILLKPEFTSDKTPMLTLVMAVAVARAIAHIAGADAEIRCS